MSEREPRREPQRYYLKYENENIELSPDNTLIYSHRSDKKYDHIYVQMPTEEDQEEQGIYLWRLDPKYSHQFEMMISNLLAINVTMITHNDISEFDLKQWTARFAGRPTQALQASQEQMKEPEYKELTQRQERLIEFMAYILLKEKLAAEDFDGEGELYL